MAEVSSIPYTICPSHQMDKKVFLTLVICVYISTGMSQNIAINNDGSLPNAHAILDIKSGTKGLLIPRMDSTARKSIPGTKGLLVYDSSFNAFWFYNGSSWQNQVTGSGWALGGNTSTNPAVNFIGTTDNQPMRLRLNNTWAGSLDNFQKNYFIGDSAGLSNTTGQGNIGIGSHNLPFNTSGTLNASLGFRALDSNTNGSYNAAFGSYTLNANISGWYNTAMGFGSLSSNTPRHWQHRSGCICPVYCHNCIQ